MKKVVYLGTTNPVKIEAVKKVLEPLGYEVIAQEVDSGVGKQPLNDLETMKGAYNRAYALPKNSPRMGLEAGVEQHNDQLFLVNWGILLDEFDKSYYAGGTRIPLPEVIRNAIINEGLELSDAMEVYFKTKNIKHQEGAIGYFTNNFVKRHDIFEHIVKLLIGQYLKQKEDEQ